MSKAANKKYNNAKVIKKRKLSLAGWLILFMLPAIILLGIAVIILLDSYKKTNTTLVEYAQSGDFNYKVYLKENVFYEKDYLDEDMQYIASIIDRIKVNYNYELHANGNINLDYGYEVIGTIKIVDKNDSTKVIHKKEETIKLLNMQSKSDNNVIINDTIDIDYEKYNKYVSQFKKDLNISADSYLELDFNIYDKGNVSKSSDKLDYKYTYRLKIPLNEQMMSITKESPSIDSTGSFKIVSISYNKNASTIFLVLTFSIGIILFISGLVVYKKKDNNNSYDRMLRKILKEYDSYILKSKSSYIDDDSEIVDVDKFDELLNAQRIEDKPIIFYEVIKGKKSYFIINGEKNVYKYTLYKNTQEEHNSVYDVSNEDDIDNLKVYKKSMPSRVSKNQLKNKVLNEEDIDLDDLDNIDDENERRRK